MVTSWNEFLGALLQMASTTGVTVPTGSPSSSTGGTTSSGSTFVGQGGTSGDSFSFVADTFSPYYHAQSEAYIATSNLSSIYGERLV